MPVVVDGHLERNKQAFAELIREEDEMLRWQREKIALIQRVLRELKPSGAIADVGCFTGAATATYRDTGFRRAVGFDMSAECLERAASRGIEPRYWPGGAEPCPAAHGEFDVVVAADVIEHIVNTDAFLSELKRVLRPGGHLVVTTPNLAFWISRLRLLRGKTPWAYPGASPTVRHDIMIDLNHIRLNTVVEWSELFASQQFKIVKTLGWSILHAKGDALPVRMVRAVDRWMTRRPGYAFGLLFLLRKVN